MAFYENTLVAKQDLAEKDLKTIKDKYSEIINSSFGKIVKIEEWGLLNLAKKIKNYKKGFYIHFKFADGSKMKKAFEYHWRFWTIPEVKEMLAEAGFRKSLVYWDIAPEDEEAEWKAVNKAPNDDSWLCYIVGVK